MKSQCKVFFWFQTGENVLGGFLRFFFSLVSIFSWWILYRYFFCISCFAVSLPKWIILRLSFRRGRILQWACCFCIFLGRKESLRCIFFRSFLPVSRRVHFWNIVVLLSNLRVFGHRLCLFRVNVCCCRIWIVRWATVWFHVVWSLWSRFLFFLLRVSLSFMESCYMTLHWM